VAAFADAIRAGRTLATNGPWVELLVDGRAPGDPVELPAGRRLPVTVRCQGPGVERLELVGPDGALATATGGGGAAPAIDTEVVADDSLWLCAVARGPGHPAVLGPVVFAHTSPVWVQVGGRPVHRPASARWLLDWLDRFEALLAEHGRFAGDDQRQEVMTVLGRARRWYQEIADGRRPSSVRLA
jgi:hypothetical protein